MSVSRETRKQLEGDFMGVEVIQVIVDEYRSKYRGGDIYVSELKCGVSVRI